MTLDMKKFEVVSVTFASACTSNIVLQKSNDLGVTEKVWSK